MLCCPIGTNMFAEVCERMTKELTASVPSTMKIIVVAPPDGNIFVVGHCAEVLLQCKDSSLGAALTFVESCPCMMKHNFHSHLSGRRFLPQCCNMLRVDLSVRCDYEMCYHYPQSAGCCHHSGDGLPLWHNNDFFDGCHGNMCSKTVRQVG